MTESDLLKKIIAADAVDWNYPSARAALAVHALEDQYREMFGKEPPPWPRRGRA
jgi:hypothetical protein